MCAPIGADAALNASPAWAQAIRAAANVSELRLARVFEHPLHFEHEIAQVERL